MKSSEEGKKNIQQSIRFYPLLYNVTALILLCIYQVPKFSQWNSLYLANYNHFCFDHHNIICCITIFIHLLMKSCYFFVILSSHTFVDDSFPHIGTRQLRFRSQELSHPDVHIQIYRHMANGNMSEVSVVNFSV